MERNEGIIRWSPNPSRDEFLSINLNHRVVQIYQATGHAQPSRFEYQKVSKHNEFPPLSSYDWSPIIPGLIAMGTSRGAINLLRADDGSNGMLTLPLKLQRPCQSVAFNTTGLLAVGLERIRNDSCLQIWDVNQRLADWDHKQPGFAVPDMGLEPKRMEPSQSVTSIKFFEDQPQTLVVGIKNHSVRIHDLRDPSSSVITFQTRMNNNLAIDFADQNYFASSALDQPGLVVWDRRVLGRSTTSPMYLESFDKEEISWGASLHLKQAIDSEKNVYIRQLRYCRDRRGALGVLSGAGQLQVFQTNTEYFEPGSVNDVPGSPELLEVERSYDLEYPYFDPTHKRRFEDRIVSFDWLNSGISDVPNRVIALRANGSFEILQMPPATVGVLSNLVPWKPPRSAERPYNRLMRFSDSSERAKQFGLLLATEIKSNLPLFGTDKISAWKKNKPLVDAVIQEYLSTLEYASNVLAGEEALDSVNEALGNRLAREQTGPYSRGLLHEKSHISRSHAAAEKHDPELMETFMLSRAKIGYLFDININKSVVGDNQELQEVWDWIGGAEEAAHKDGMIAGELDLSYMGVFTIWSNSLGLNFRSRLIESTIIPDAIDWERLIGTINKRAGRHAFEGVKTSKPQHRQLCLAICGFAKSADELDQDLQRLENQGKYTTAAAWALFEGVPDRAVEILRRGGTELLFIAIAMDIKLKSQSSLGIDSTQWGQLLASHPQMTKDPYLRAIYSFITSGNWAEVVDETALPLRDRVCVALRNFPDNELTDWLTKQMDGAIQTGNIEGIVLAGITENMTDILAKYVDKFSDYQTPTLIMSYCAPRYIKDIRCAAWSSSYKELLQRHRQFLLRVKFEQQSSRKSRDREGVPVIKPPPIQITIRCLKCDNAIATPSLGTPPPMTVGVSKTKSFGSPLAVPGVHAGLCCPRCGAHLPRCAICMETVGVPRSDRPELSFDPAIRRMANFPTFCMKCKHVSHMEHSVAWFRFHNECPVPECRCQCNERSDVEGVKRVFL